MAEELGTQYRQLYYPGASEMGTGEAAHPHKFSKAI